MKRSRLFVLLVVTSLAFGLVGLSLEVASASAGALMAMAATRGDDGGVSQPVVIAQADHSLSYAHVRSTHASVQSPRSNSAMMPGFLPSEQGASISVDKIQSAASAAGAPTIAYAPDAILPGFTIDLAHDVVMGKINPGDRVVVAVGTSYGAAVADAAGFFWTPIWQLSGSALDLVGGQAVQIAVNGAVVDTPTPAAISGGIAVLDDDVDGTLTGLGSGVAVTVTLGGWGQLPVPGAAVATGLTGPSGVFSLSFDGVDLTPGNLAQVDYRATALTHVRGYLHASPLVFAVANNNRAVGYVNPNQHVRVRAYSSYPSTVIWQAEADADLLGYYDVSGSWNTVPAGSVFEVLVDGSTIITTTVANLHHITFDADLDQVSGTAPANAAVLVYFYAWEDDHQVYTQTTVTANGSGAFSASFSADLLVRDDVGVFVHDEDGNSTAILGGAPYVEALLMGNTGCVTGRTDAPGQAVLVSLQTTTGIYTRTATTNLTDAGNLLRPSNLCYDIRGTGWGPLPFAPGNVVRIQSQTWSGSVTIPELAWQPDTLADQISGEAPGGEVRVDVTRWNGAQYPDRWVASRLTTVLSDTFSADFASFDLRDADQVVLHYYDPTSGFATQWEVAPDVHYFEVRAPWLVSGKVNTPEEVVTASLYNSAGNLLASPSTQAYQMGFSLSDFDGQPFAAGYWITVTGSSGWEAGFQIPELSVQADESTNRISGQGPRDRLFMQTTWGFKHFLPSRGTAANPSFLVNTSAYDHDLQVGDDTEVFYIAPNGDRFSKSKLWPRIVAHYGYGTSDNHVWGGSAGPHTSLPLTITTSGGSPVAAATLQSTSSGSFDTRDLPDGSIAPGNIVSMDFSGQIESMTVLAMSGGAVTSTDMVTVSAPSGTLISLEAEGPTPNDNWNSEDSYPGGLVVGPSGIVTFDLGADDYDVVAGTSFNAFAAQGHGHSTEYSFWVPVLHIRTNYTHDWIEGSFDGGHTLWITLTNSSGAIKATASGVTGPISWGEDIMGFSTDYNISWNGDDPDIEAGDWVYASVDMGLKTESHIGTINSSVDLDSDIVAGTISAPWYSSPLHGGCGIWEGTGAAMSISVNPNGGAFTCDFTGEWDIIPGNMIGISYNEPDGDQVIQMTDNPAPYLHIRSSLSGKLASGANAAFKVRYYNDGKLATENAIISATLGSGLTYLGDTSGLTLLSGSGAPGDPLIWQLGTLPPDGLERYFDLFAAVTAAPGQHVILRTQIENGIPYDQSDDPDAKHYLLNVTVANNDTHLSISKGAVTGDPAPGMEFLYRVQVCNDGNTASAEVTLTDTLPLSTTLVTWWGEQAGWEEVSSSAHELVVSRPSLTANQCYPVYVQVVLDEDAWFEMELHNTASVYAANDMELDNNFAETWHNVGTAHANLSIDKSWNWGSLTPGGEIRYNIDYANSGNLPASAVRVTDTLPVSTTFVAAYWYDDAGTHLLSPDITTTQQVAWDVGALTAGEHGSFEVVLGIDEDALPGMQITNTAAITSLPVEDRYSDNTSSVIETLYGHGPNLRVRQDGDWYPEYRYAWYRLIIENVGDVDVDLATITDTLPGGMQIKNGVGNNPDADGWVDYVRNDAEGWFSFTFSGLEAGWRREIYLDTQIPGYDPIPAGLTYTNHAEFEMLAGETLYTDNASDYTLFTGPNLYVEKSLQAGEVRPGELVTYSVLFGNNQIGHAGWWNMQGNILLTDTLPVGAEFITATQRWCGNTLWCPASPIGEDGQLTWQFDSMSGDQWNELYVTIRLTDTLTEQDTVVNRVDVSSDQPQNDLEANYEDNVAICTLPVIIPHFELYLPVLMRNY